MCYWKINHYRVIRNPLTNRSHFRYTTHFAVPPSVWYQILTSLKFFSLLFVSQLEAAGYSRLGSFRQTTHLSVCRHGNSHFYTSFIPLLTPSTVLNITLFLRSFSVLSYFFHVKIMQVNVAPKQNNTQHGAKAQARPGSQSRGVQKVSPQPVTSVSAGSTCVTVNQQTWCNMLTIRGCSGQVDDNRKGTGSLVLL
jgi:hypothetical protein